MVYLVVITRPKNRQPVLLFHGLMVVRILLDKHCATKSHSFLTQMCVLDRIAFLGFWVHQNNRLDLFWQMAGLMFGLPTPVELIPAGTIPRSPQMIRFSSQFWLRTHFTWIITSSVLTNIFRPTGIGRGTNLLPMIFLLFFSLSMITQEVRKFTILVTPW